MILLIPQKDTLQLTPNIELRRSPGHTTQDISIIVKKVNGTKTVAVAGINQRPCRNKVASLILIFTHLKAICLSTNLT